MNSALMTALVPFAFFALASAGSRASIDFTVATSPELTAFRKSSSAMAGIVMPMIIATSKSVRMMKSSAAQRTRGEAAAHVPLGASLGM